MCGAACAEIKAKGAVLVFRALVMMLLLLLLPRRRGKCPNKEPASLVRVEEEEAAGSPPSSALLGAGWPKQRAEGRMGGDSCTVRT